MENIYDIMLRKVAYLGCPVVTAYELARDLIDFIQHANLVEPDAIMPIAIDIPHNVRSDARECMAFIRIKDTRCNQNFLYNCRGRFYFRNQMVQMDVSTNAAKHQADIRKQYAWSIILEGQAYRCSIHCNECRDVKGWMEKCVALQTTSHQTTDESRVGAKRNEPETDQEELLITVQPTGERRTSKKNKKTKKAKKSKRDRGRRTKDKSPDKFVPNCHWDGYRLVPGPAPANAEVIPKDRVAEPESTAAPKSLESLEFENILDNYTSTEWANLLETDISNNQFQ